MEKFFLRPFFSRDKLNVIDQQHVYRMKPFAKAEHLVETQRIDHFNRKFFRAHVTQPRRRIALLDGMPNCMHQVRLAHAHAAIKKQRVVRFRWLLRHRPRSRMRKFVRLANHERIERIPRIQLVIAAFKVQPRLLDRSCCRRPGWRCRHRLFFRAHILHPHRRHANLMKNRFDDFAVSARQHLPEHRRRNLHVNHVRVRTIQPRWLEPGRKGIDTDTRFYTF